MKLARPRCWTAILLPVALVATLYFWLVKWPTRDPVMLQAIRAEAQAIMARPRAEALKTLDEGRYPPAIARLGPESVRVSDDGVTIMIQSEPDGGYMYFIPRTPADAPRPWAAITDLGYGVYWISRH